MVLNALVDNQENVGMKGLMHSALTLNIHLVHYAELRAYFGKTRIAVVKQSLFKKFLVI